MKSSVTANLMKTNPQYGIWQKKAQQAYVVFPLPLLPFLLMTF